MGPISRMIAWNRNRPCKYELVPKIRTSRGITNKHPKYSSGRVIRNSHLEKSSEIGIRNCHSEQSSGKVIWNRHPKHWNIDPNQLKEDKPLFHPKIFFENYVFLLSTSTLKDDGWTRNKTPSYGKKFICTKLIIDNNN